jgi:hypothetical protein
MDDGQIFRKFQATFVRRGHGAGRHLVVGAHHGGERDVLGKQRRQRVLAAGLVVVALVQQPLVELHARLFERALVPGQALLGVHPVERTRDVGDALVLVPEQRLGGEISAQLVVEAEAVIVEPAYLAVHDHERRGVVVVVHQEFVGQAFHVHDERIAVAAHQEADGLALLLFLAVAGGDQHEFAGGFERLFDGREHRAEERTVQLRDQHPDRVAAARGQRLRDGIRLVPQVAHRGQHLLPGLVADLGTRIDDARHGGQRHPRELRDFVDVGHD